MTGGSTSLGANGPTRTKLAVCVCTYRRPEELERLLARLAQCASDASELCATGVVVIDDDTECSATPVLEGWADRFELGLRTRCTASGSISVARNAALELGLDMADWLALVDDDCVPDPDWLRRLLEVQARTGADTVCGACVDVPPADAPRWLLDEPFLERLGVGEDGAPTAGGHLKNVLLSAEFLRAHPVRFDPQLGRVGGEDAAFLWDLHSAGSDRRFAAGAVVSEQVPPDRARLGYQLRRRFWFGNTEALSRMRTAEASRVRVLISGVRQMASAAAGPLIRLTGDAAPQWRFALSEVLRGLGRALAVFGVRVRHR